MDQFMKIRKKEKLAEATRQVLNKSIDLLHKLSKKKITLDTAKREVETLLSNHYIQNNGEGIDTDQKVRLEYHLSQAEEIIEKVDKGTAPLYEGIMLMNKVIAGQQSAREEIRDETAKREESEESFLETPVQRREFSEESIQKVPSIKRTVIEKKDEPGMVSTQFDRSGKQVEEELIKPVKIIMKEENNKSEVDVQDLMQEVIRNKKVLEKSILSLNQSLHAHGFELRPI